MGGCMTPETIAQIVAVHRRTVAQHPDWTGKLLLEAVCFRCYATHGLELEHEDVLAAVQNLDQIPAPDGCRVSA